LLLPATGICFQVTAQVDKTRIAPGERVSLQVVVDGGKAEVDLSPMGDFQILSSGTSTSRSYTNGEWTYQVVYQYQLVPEKTGVLVIPPLTVVHEKQTLMTEEIRILVSEAPLPADQPRQLFVEAQVASPDLVVGQQTVYTIKLFAAARFARASLKAPAFASFAARELEERKNYTQTVNGIPYLVNEVYYILQAEKPGRFEIAPAVIMADLIQSSGNDPLNSFFNDSFFSAARTKSVQVASNSLSLEVSPLPPLPGDKTFSGLVGQFTMGTAIDKPTLSVGESATLTLTIQGTGNIMDAGSLPLNLDKSQVKIYEDTPIEEMAATAEGYSGKKIFKRALVPVQEGILVIPSLSLTYFDVDVREYKTILTDKIFLDVRENAVILTPKPLAENGPGPDPGKSTDHPVGPAKQEVVMVNKDILDIRDTISILSNPVHFDFSLFVLLVMAPGLIYGCFALVFHLQTREKSIGTRMGQKAKAALKTGEKLAASGKPFLNHLQLGLVAAILAKGDKQGESLTCDEARQILTRTGTQQTLIDEVVTLLETLDASRFGGQTMDASKATLFLGRVKQVIKMLCITLCCMGLFVHAAPFAFAGDKADGTGLTEPFIDGIEQYRSGNFDAAAKSFETIARSGVVNPDLFYNIGNAYLKANDLGQAILWYERAKRLAPADPDLLFNLAHADTLVKDKIDVPLTLWDILFFWQGVLPLKWIQACAVGFSCLFFLWAGRQTLGRKQIFSGPGWILILLLVLFFMAGAMEDYRSRAENMAVIVRQTAAVRSGMMESSTKLFELHAGTRVQVKAQKNGCLKIRLSKGRVGWVRPGDARII
ncbi:MAG: tetratricopeptide repeat protein, partial [Desulfobacula sp.]|nr:tetratricopeptide repeat protein [Desulfobacula sp.]